MRHFLCYCFLILSIPAWSQQMLSRSGLQGYWSGAFIQDNAVQLLHAEFYLEDDTLRVRSNIDAWIYYSGKVSNVDTLPNGYLQFDTYLGTAVMAWDSAYQEMIGRIENQARPTRDLKIHLKRSLRPPVKKLVLDTLEVKNKEVDLFTYTVMPEGKEVVPCLVFVHGRGCSSGDYFLGRARVLAQYGIGSVIFHKRGNGRSGGDCNTATLAQLSSDIDAVLQVVSKQKRVDPERLGMIGYSAGGWLVPHVATRTKVPLAFLITAVGPATSVLQQQLDGGRYYGSSSGYSEKALAQLDRYTELLFAKDNLAQTHRELTQLLVGADSLGWRDWLEDTDIAATPEDIPQLWVQRFEYDPEPDLKQIKIPYLAIFGAEDKIVPLPENAPLLKKYLEAAGNQHFRIVSLPMTGHGLEHGDRLRSIPLHAYANPTYFKFDRVAAGTIEEIISFILAL